jgi:S-adenosylmethionine:tRNA ribosyltransferase-isomerase
MRLKDFDYSLPACLIAQHPPEKRGDSRLMVLHRKEGTLEHHAFSDLPEYLQPGDVLVVNDTKVLPARLIGKKVSGGRVEILLVRRRENGPARHHSQEWECLVQGAGKLPNKIPVLLDPAIRAELLERTPDGLWRLSLRGREDEELDKSLERIGFAPLPPYIHRNGDVELRARDLDRYQTVYARSEGAIAAPTAGLHFTEGLLEKIRRKGISVLSLTLHVGMGTFLPVKEEEVERHRLEPELFEITPDTARSINEARAAGRRVLGVGTTVTRALESTVDQGGKIQALKGQTDLFILPGHRFRSVDGLVTNFHLPRSTLLMLVSAFAGREFILAAYEEAIRGNYRFYSYGDAMLIL